MGTRIGVGAEYTASARAAEIGRMRSRPAEDGLGRTSARDAARDVQAGFFGAREARDELRAGFGKGTITAPAAAVRTVRRNMHEARQLVPTFEELQEETRARIEDQQRTLREAAPGRRGDALALRRGEIEEQARSQARELINRLDETAGIALARTRGEEPPPPPQTDIRVGDETITFGPVRRQPMFDVRV